jgi:hypothetical protein
MLFFGTGLFVWMLFGTIANLNLQHVLRQQGRTVDGQITTRSVNRGGDLVSYAFQVDGVLYSGQAEMESDDYTLPDDPRGISIRYLTSDPNVSQPVKWQWISIWDMGPLALLLTIAAVGALIVLRALRLRKLMRNGIVTTAKVTGSATKKKLFTVYYEFPIEDGVTVEGSTDLMDEYGAGATIPVIYLPNNPKVNRRFPINGFRIVE